MVSGGTGMGTWWLAPAAVLPTTELHCPYCGGERKVLRDVPARAEERVRDTKTPGYTAGLPWSLGHWAGKGAPRTLQVCCPPPGGESEPGSGGPGHGATSPPLGTAARNHSGPLGKDPGAKESMQGGCTPSCPRGSAELVTPRSCRFENRFPLSPLPCWPGCGSPTLLGWPEVGRRGRQPGRPPAAVSGSCLSSGLPQLLTHC